MLDLYLSATADRQLNTPSYTRMAIGFLAAWTLLRLVFAGTIELSGDEAYYWLWSRNLDWCYYSKGPLVAWVIAAGTRLLGDTDLGVRCGAVLLGTGTACGIYLLALRLFQSPRIGFWSMIVASVTPLYVAGSVLMTIDPISIFFWVWAMLAFLRARDSDRIAPWAWTGLLVGLGMLGKYTNVAQLASFGLICAWERPLRRHFRQATFWMLVLVALACLLPVIEWNARHEWASFVHIRHRGALDRQLQFSPAQFGHFVVGQALVMFPPFFLGLLLALWRSPLRASQRTAWRFLLGHMIPLYAVYGLLSFNDKGLPNWTAPAYPAAFLLLTATWLPWMAEDRRARLAGRISMGIAIAGALLFLGLSRVKLPTRGDMFQRVRGYRDLAAQVDAFRAECGAEYVIAAKYGLAGHLAFYLPGRPMVYMPTSDRIENQFSFWPGYADSIRAGATAVFIDTDLRPQPHLYHEFERVELRRSTWSMYGPHPIKQFHFFLCDGYVAPEQRMARSMPGEAPGDNVPAREDMP